MKTIAFALKKAGITPSLFLQPSVIDRARKEMVLDLKIRRRTEVRALLEARVPIVKLTQEDIELAVREFGARRTTKGQLIMPGMRGWSRAGVRVQVLS